MSGGIHTERCIAMIKRSTLTGEAITKAILCQVRKLNLPLSKFVGQGCDECSDQAVIKESCPQAVCVHCVAHLLNLVLMKACSLPSIHHPFEVIIEVGTFFRSGTKQNGYQTAAINHLPGRTSSRWKLQIP